MNTNEAELISGLRDQVAQLLHENRRLKEAAEHDIKTSSLEELVYGISADLALDQSITIDSSGVVTVCAMDKHFVCRAAEAADVLAAVTRLQRHES